MLRGRTLAERDSSICALCRYRASLRPATAPTRRLFSATPRASDNGSGRPIPFRPIPPAGASAGFLNASASPTAPNYPSTNLGPPLPHGPNSLQNGQAPTFLNGPPVPGLPTFKRKTTDNSILDAHEARARANILAAEKAAKPVQQTRQTLQKTPNGALDPRVNARYVWNSQRQQEIESYIRSESIDRFVNVSKSKEPSPTLSKPIIGNETKPGFNNRFHPQYDRAQTEAAPTKPTTTPSTFSSFRTIEKPPRMQQPLPRLGYDRNPTNTSRRQGPVLSSLPEMQRPLRRLDDDGSPGNASQGGGPASSRLPVETQPSTPWLGDDGKPINTSQEGKPALPSSPAEIQPSTSWLRDDEKPINTSQGGEPALASSPAEMQPSTPWLRHGGKPINTPQQQGPAASSLSSLVGSPELWSKKIISYPSKTKSPVTSPLNALGDLKVQNPKSAPSTPQPSESWREWGQLARKPTVQKNLEDDFWNALRKNVRKSQPGGAETQGTERVPPNPSSVSKPNEPLVPQKDPWKTLGASVTGPEQARSKSRNTEGDSPNPWAISKPSAIPVSRNDPWKPLEANVAKSEPARSMDQNTAREFPNPSVVPNEIPVPANDPWKMQEANMTTSEQEHSRNQNTKGDFPDPQVVPEAEMNPIPDSFDRESEFFERGEKHAKRRGGKGSRRKSRFEDHDDHEVYENRLDTRQQKQQRKAEREAARMGPIPIILPELISITAFAQALKVKPEDFVVQLGEFGFEGVTLDSLMAGETAALVAQEYGYEPTVDAGDRQDLKPRPPPADPSALPPRPPVVTIMGHVDHGKTTILDYLRKSSVAAQEHGGITQHIGAFSVKLSSGKPITFLDTPGHAAFLTMRQRGANVTDIIVLVVAADDSVMPQTLEALKHARAAKVPIIVAINKIDAEGARIDAVKHDLAQAGIEIEDFGGDVQVVCVSGKTGQGMEDLEENILALSEILDHRAEPDGPAEGWVLESSLKPSGKVATVLVKRGTLRPGDHIAAGLTWGKIRQLRNEAGVDVAEAPPGTPVEIIGWKELPAAGDQVIQGADEARVKTAVSYRESVRGREKDAAEYEIIAEARKQLEEQRALEEATGSPTEKEDGPKMVNFVVKGDVHGSVEAVCAAIQEIGNNEVRPRILRSATGAISEFDVAHAATSKSVIINFATVTPGHVMRMAESQGVRILEHHVIYHLLDDVKANLSEYLAPAVTSRVLGEAEILQIFPINIRGRKHKNIAGCRVRTGIIGKNNLYRVRRKGIVIFDGKLETLKHGKDDVMEMRKDNECGMGFDGFQDLAVGDTVQAYQEVKTRRTL
ncbi:hypothetical protein F4861DRAFT_105844 [Xylaria intraflava]|nr:hypothetical protein F4861DRAFT_105844 [Xylaria intraflava]